jgi:hypothetical protein
MMTKFKSVSAQTPKLVGKNLAKVKGGGDGYPQQNCLIENISARNLGGPIHGCLTEVSARNLTGPFHGCLTEVSARNLIGPFHGCLTEEAQ